MNWGFLRMEDAGPLVADAVTTGLTLAILATERVWSRRRMASTSNTLAGLQWEKSSGFQGSRVRWTAAAHSKRNVDTTVVGSQHEQPRICLRRNKTHVGSGAIK